jgi:uncharacterized protein (UPF0262 family)
MMSHPALPPLRKEVKDYLTACEHLFADALTSTTPPFSKEELESLEFYAAEFAANVLIHRVQDQ